MLEAVELTRLIVNKTVVPERRERGRRGYGRRPAVRLLVYAQQKGIHEDKSLEKYLRENRHCNSPRLDGIPDRTTIGRWKKRLEPILRKAFEKISSVIQMLVPTEDLVVDSAPLEDERDPDVERGSGPLLYGFFVVAS